MSDYRYGYFKSLKFKSLINVVNPFKSNGISYCYQLDESISVLRVVGGIFHFKF